ncbi:hypothetical protein, partial [Pseudomonas avellanae]|uniref:hypothetical protein n=1 Tax=Pseudomonas avellanae TaxID=46257 RepID=UPI001E42FED8
ALPICSVFAAAKLKNQPSGFFCPTRSMYTNLIAVRYNSDTLKYNFAKKPSKKNRKSETLINASSQRHQSSR